ncbi:LPS export ABC transporter permease LptG [Sphingomonas paeninsulae]|jgi:lipopolysaccharide export system permease protein|uniref:LPS export ABC transporter permease LptG n=1 Tax=Sphingomonas paeninsulae TaxID=2319844 RepID=A0A494T9S4_SPHPE|nr:LPS export ABC transporter permease LptG [Sphingomonas paeninsulae]AYJ86127.1 LPS export ABC transporter permease LptG [Sphingomonas paeninsulae]
MPSFFPSRTIALYMGKMFVVRSFAVLALLLLILQMLDLLSESDKILAVKGNGQHEIMTYVGLRLPQLAQRFLPFCVLLGTLITLVTLNQNSEVVSMKAAGLSAHQVLAPLIVASLAIATMSFFFNERIVTRSSATLDRWQNANYGKIPSGDEAQANVWVRAGNDLIHAEDVTGRGTNAVLTGVEIYSRKNGELAEILRAPRGTAVRGGGWALTSANIFDVTSGTIRELGPITIGKNIRPDQFTLSNVDGAGLSLLQLKSTIDELEAAGRPVASLQSILWHKISGPLSTVLMPLLGAVAAFGLARSGALFVRAVIGMGLGFAYFVADNFGLAMGNLGAYPPLLAAWGPFFLFLLIGEAVLIRTEE